MTLKNTYTDMLLNKIGPVPGLSVELQLQNIRPNIIQFTRSVNSI